MTCWNRVRQAQRRLLEVSEAEVKELQLKLQATIGQSFQARLKLSIQLEQKRQVVRELEAAPLDREEHEHHHEPAALGVGSPDLLTHLEAQMRHA